MPTSQPRVQLISLADTGGGTSVKTGEFEPHPSAVGVTLFSSFDGDGTLAVLRVNTDDLTTTLIEEVAITGGTPAVTTYTYNTGPLRVTYTPDTADQTGYVEAQYYGYAGSGA